MMTTECRSPFRADTLLGVCHAMAADLRVNVLWLRLAFSLPMLLAPVLTVIAYALLGLTVLVGHLLWPEPRKALVKAGAA